MNIEQIKLATQWVQKLKKAWFIIFNIAYAVLNVVYASLLFYFKTQTIPWIPYVLIVVAVSYLITFALILCLKNKNTKRIAVKNYRASVKIFKNSLALSNLILSILIIVNTAKYDFTSFTFALTIINIVAVVSKMLITIINVIRSNRRRHIKEQKRVLKKEMFSDIKSIILSVEQEENREETELEQKYEHNEVASIKDLTAMRPIEQIKTLVSAGIISVCDNAGKIALRIAEYRDASKLISNNPNE